MFSGPQLLLDGLKTKRARQRAREQVAESMDLIGQADAILGQVPSNEEDEGYWSTGSDFEGDYSDARSDLEEDFSEKRPDFDEDKGVTAWAPPQN